MNKIREEVARIRRNEITSPAEGAILNVLDMILDSRITNAPPDEPPPLKDDDLTRRDTSGVTVSDPPQPPTEKAPRLLQLEQLLADYRAAEDADRGLGWYWCDEIEDRIGRERYREIMFGAKEEK